MKKGKAAKKAAIAVVTAVAVGGVSVGGYYGIRQAQKTTVKVYPVSDFTSGYWGDSMNMEGQITSTASQNIYLSDSQTISQVLVKEGDVVNAGDTLMTYDTSMIKLDLETQQLQLAQTKLKIQQSEKELEKLFCYCMGKEEIEVRDIEAICTTQITNKIFEMVEAVAVRNQKKALDYYYDLLALKEPPMRILYLLTRQFKLLLEVKDLAGKRYDKAAIAKTVGLHPFVAGKYMQQCRTFEKKELRSILEDAVDTEELVKTGRLNDVMSVELFIVKYSAA